MSVTSTTAPTRLALNTWKSRTVVIRDDGTGIISVDFKDSAGTQAGTISINVYAGQADRAFYTPEGAVSVETLGVTSAGIGAALLTALSSGSLSARFQAVDTLMQARGVFPA